jgi:hypothetical protein
MIWQLIFLCFDFGNCQQAIAGISHISFAEEESVSPKKPTTLPEVAKQRELSGTLESESDAMLKKQISSAKSKELSGHDIFAPPPEILPRPTTVRALALQESIQLGEPSPRNVSTSVKLSNTSLCGCINKVFCSLPVPFTLALQWNLTCRMNWLGGMVIVVMHVGQT